MAELSLRGRAAVVTGAGRGIGRAHALLLASRGAAVVVNDIDAAAAGSVVDEIVAAGGQALVSTHDIASETGGEDLVAAVIAEFGSADIVVHNAGVVEHAPFGQVPADQLTRLLAVHFCAAYYVGQPAWRWMAANGRGRIVLTSSAGIFGDARVPTYGGAKAGLLGLAASMHLETVQQGVDIKVNVIAPLAATRPRVPTAPIPVELATPDNVAALVGYLASDECAVGGQCFRVGATFVGRIYLGVADGWSSGGTPLTPESVADHIDEITSTAGGVVPTSSADLLVHMNSRITAAAGDSVG
ncbi:MAG: SDR family NAD(P)-dependent oxidoreductase [Actinomycetota bacterium]|nr:MAG: SDR family NAD(P)-dependent oxidoreductase [Actinomycetota bacterium]